MTLRARDPLGAGGKLPAHVLNQLVNAARAGQSATSSGDLDVSAGDLGVSVSDPRPRPIWVQITSGSNPYAWTQVDEDNPPTFPQLAIGGFVQSGNLSTDVDGNYVQLPAYEVNGRTDVAPGTKVQIWLAPSHDLYLFCLDSPCLCDAHDLPPVLYAWKNRVSGECPNSACQDCYVLTSDGTEWAGSDLLTQCTYRLRMCSWDPNYGGIHDNYVIQATGGCFGDHMMNPITIISCAHPFLATWVDLCCGDVWTISDVPGGACAGSGSGSLPPPTSYNCVAGACVQISGTGGQYPTVGACLAACPGSNSYNCVSGVCVQVEGTGGTYSTLNACLTACGSGVSYNCTNGQCVQVSGTGGTYATLAACEAACSGGCAGYYGAIGGCPAQCWSQSGTVSQSSAGCINPPIPSFTVTWNGVSGTYVGSFHVGTTYDFSFDPASGIVTITRASTGATVCTGVASCSGGGISVSLSCSVGLCTNNPLTVAI